MVLLFWNRNADDRSDSAISGLFSPLLLIRLESDLSSSLGLSFLRRVRAPPPVIAPCIWSRRTGRFLFAPLLSLDFFSLEVTVALGMTRLKRPCRVPFSARPAASTVLGSVLYVINVGTLSR